MKNIHLHFDCDSSVQCLPFYDQECCQLNKFHYQLYHLNMLIFMSLIIISCFLTIFLLMKPGKNEQNSSSSQGSKRKNLHNMSQSLNRSMGLNITFSGEQSFVAPASRLSNQINVSQENDKEENNSDNNSQTESNFFSCGDSINPILNMYIKLCISYILFAKLLEISFINNLAMPMDGKLPDDKRKIQICFKLIFEIFLIFTSLAIFHFPVLEFYKRNLCIIGFYLYLLILNSTSYHHTHHNDARFMISVGCSIILILMIILSIHSHSIFSAKLNREETISEKNYQKEAIDRYSKTLHERKIELYPEITRVLDMCKLLEIMENVRVNRKQMLNVGLIFLFVLSLALLAFNGFNYKRHLKYSYMGTPNKLSFHDMHEEDIEMLTMPSETGHKKILMVVISNMTSYIAESNHEYMSFINRVTKNDKSGRVYTIHSKDNAKTVGNLATLFTGSNPELNGIIGNKYKTKRLSGFDSIFRKMKKKGIQSRVIVSNEFQSFFKTNFPDAEIVTNRLHKSLNLLDDHSNPKYTDEKNFQIALDVINKTISSSNKEFTLLHFSEILFNLHPTSLIQQTLTDQIVSRKMIYLNRLYDQINSQTLLFITSDTQVSPLIVISKQSSFSEESFSHGNVRSFQYSDVTATLCAMLGVDIPLQNQGRYIDDILKLGKFSESDRKVQYYKLKQQQQKLYLKILSTFEKHSSGNCDLTREINGISQQSMPFKEATAEEYESDITDIGKLYIQAIEDMLSIERSQNFIYSLTIALFSGFLALILIHNLTFAHIIGIFSLNLLGKRNFLSLFTAVICWIIYFSISLLLIKFFDDGNDITLEANTQDYVIKFLLIPFFTAISTQKLVFFFCFYSWSVTGIKRKYSFCLWNLTRNIQTCVLSENGLAYIYLFRLYSLIVTMVLSLVSFIISSRSAFRFSSESLISFLLYRNNGVYENQDRSHYLLILMIYQTVNLLCLYSYPTFSKFKQVYDSLFVLYDLKSAEKKERNDKGREGTCEMEAFESKFMTRFVNYDTQSPYYYRYKHFSTSNSYQSSFSEKFCSVMVLHSILATQRTIKEIEVGSGLIQTIKREAVPIVEDIELNQNY